MARLTVGANVGRFTESMYESNSVELNTCNWNLQVLNKIEKIHTCTENFDNSLLG